MSNIRPFIQENTQVRVLEDKLLQARREINNLRQQLTSLNHVHRKECDEITSKLLNWRCLECRTRQVSGESHAEGAAAIPPPDLTVTQIGTVYTNFPEKRGTPRQPGICGDTVAKLILNSEVFTNPCHSVEGLEEFSHMWVLFYFHKNDSTHVRAKVAPPRLNGARTGVFATRSPHRPSPIGLSLVKIDRVMGNLIYFSGVDMVDQTPVLDIKPYIPQYDNPSLINNLLNDRNSASTSSDTQVSDLSNLNLSTRTMDGEENNRSQRDVVLGAASSDNLTSDREELIYSRLNSRMGEREAPDGEEEEPPSNNVNAMAIPVTPEGHIRVPSWIDQPPVASLSVSFRERALNQLSQLGVEGEEKKRIISNVLREDPRSVYLRERWGSHCYVFRISELYVSCKFNDVAHSVTVYQVFRNAAEPENDD